MSTEFSRGAASPVRYSRVRELVKLFLGLVLISAILLACGMDETSTGTSSGGVAATGEGCSDGTCQSGCTYDVECPSGLCIGGQCLEPMACSSSGGCPAVTPVCGGDGVCAQCVGDADCPTDARCLGGRCGAGCSDDAACGATMRCDPVVSACVQCQTDGDCPESLHCAEFRCVADSCDPGSSICATADSNAILTCLEDGRLRTPLFCLDGTTCAEADGLAGCATWTCEPDTTWCSDDFTTLHACASTGLSELSPVECAKMGGACRDGACEEVVCEPDALRCEAPGVMQCDPTGTKWALKEGCLSGEYCDADAGQCKPKTCEADQPMCDGSTSTVCLSNGAGPAPGGTNCADSGEACHDGACRPVVCDGYYECIEGNVHSCNENSTSTSIYRYCSGGSHCRDDSASCTTDVCPQGLLYCTGNVRHMCAADGSGPVDAGMNCGDDVCVSGQCLPKICVPNSYICEGGNSRRCNSTGTGSTLYDTCLTGEHCVEGVASCRVDVCSQGANYCQSNTALICNADGSAAVGAGTPCGTQQCYGGECRDVICSTYHCVGGNVFSCSGLGTTESLYESCSEAEHCLEGSWYCRADTCTANAPICTTAGNLSTCAADGSGPIDGGTPCPDGQGCNAGACVSVVCAPGALRCQAGTLRERERCNANGTAWVAGASPCANFELCDQASEQCAPLRCAAGAATCDGESLATCSADGSGYASTSATDCSAGGGVCGGTSCASTASDGFTTSDYSFATQEILYQEYYVSTSRVLTNWSTRLYLPSSPRTLTWVVYEGDSRTGTFNLIFSESTVISGSGFHTAGSPIANVPLEAGKFYLVGTRANLSITHYYSIAQSAPYFTSFGSSIGFGLFSVGATPPATYSPEPYVDGRVSMTLNTEVAP